MKQKVILTGDWDEGIDDIDKLLEGSQYQIIIVGLGEVRNQVKKRVSDVCIFCMKEESDDLLKKVQDIKKLNEGFPVFVYSKIKDIEFVVKMMKAGVSDFFVPPLDKNIFLSKLGKEVHLFNLTQKIFMHSRNPLDDYSFENMIGRSQRMQDNFQMIAAVAKSNATVLVTGESGVGKELVAKAIHKLSSRSNEKIVDINCGAIPRDLLENELFGHEKGAYTGAHRRYVGSFEQAHCGSLFLDEISEMDVHLQVKLLRVLQERTFHRIGGTERINVDVRIIAASNRDLKNSIQRGEFREDLFYRLNVVNIQIPSLRERRDDIPLLAKHFLDYYSAKNNRIIVDFSPEAMEAFINYDWPGNVRELENTVERIVVLNDISQVKLKHLPPHFLEVDRSIGYSEEQSSHSDDVSIIPLEELEKKAIEAALMKFQGNISIAAKKLKIGQATLYRKVKKFGLNH